MKLFLTGGGVVYWLAALALSAKLIDTGPG